MTALGICLLHSLWQGALIALALALVLAAIGPGRPEARYLAATVALGAWALAPVLTVLTLRAPSTASGSGAPPAGLPEALVVAWIAGASLMVLRLLVQSLSLRRLLARATPLEERWQERAAQLARSLGLQRAVRVLRSTEIDVPLAAGLLRPVILLPLSALSALPVAQLEAILLHELAHVRRLDYLVNLLQLAVEALLFHHPATHWISRQIRVEREYCCDDEVVRRSGDPLAYARALERLEGLRHPTTLALAANEGALMLRIRRLLTPSPAPRGRQSLAMTVGLIATVTVLTLALHHRAEAYATWLVGAIRPVEGARVSLPFGQQQNPFSGRPYFHEGIDLANALGTAVSAPLAGEVVFAAADGDRGNVVVLRHGEGLESRYHHLGDIAVRPGQRLSKGERLGSIGETGKTTGPHVHVELREHGVAIDPSPIVD